MKQQDGIALIAAITIMMFILAIAFGMLFLTESNLRIAENARSQAIAKARAEAGTDATFLALEHFYNENGSFPDFFGGQFSGFTAPTITIASETLPYSVNDFQVLGDNALLKILAGTANGASHLSEVLFETLPSSTDPWSNPSISQGLVSEGTVTLNGQNNFVSAGMHGNQGYSISSLSNTNFRTCLERNSDGICINFYDVATENLPVSAAVNQSSYVCSPANSTICQDGLPVRRKDPITIAVNYSQRRDLAIANADVRSDGISNEGIYNSTFSIYCDVNYDTPPSLNNAGDVTAAGFIEGQTVCINSGTVTFPGGIDLDGVTIISRNNLQFNDGGDMLLANSTLISKEGCVNLNVTPLTLQDSRVFSSCDITLNGQQTSYLGQVTLASNANITVNGSSTVVNQDGELGIGLGLIASNNITVNGNSNWFAAAMAGNTFTYNGNATLFGGVSAKGNITVNGGIDIDSGLSIFNEDFFDDSNSEYMHFTQKSRR